MNRLFLKLDPYILGINHITAAFLHPSGRVSIWISSQPDPIHLPIRLAETAWTWLTAFINRDRFLLVGPWVLGKRHITAALRSSEEQVTVWVARPQEAVELTSEAAQTAWAWLSTAMQATDLSPEQSQA